MAIRNRLGRAPATPPPQPRAMVAAATLISQAQLKSLTKKSGPGGESWQDEAWEHYDICGEFRYAANWIGNVLSRVRLFPAYQDDQEDEAVAIEDGRPAEILAQLHGGTGGQSQMLKRLGVHLSVPGESFVVTWNDGGTQRWATLCGDEISEKAGKQIAQVDGEDVELPPDNHIIRVWRPHPRKHWDADSPGRGLLPTLRELERLSARVIAQIESRLAGNGVLFLPDSMTFPVEDADGKVRTGSDVSEFMAILARAMITPIQDRDSAAAVVPILAQAPPDAIDAIKHMGFSTELDAQTIALREAALKRLALGVDMPPEILLGLGDSNHWNAWEINENAITQHVEPLMGVIVDAFAANYLRPALYDESFPDAERWGIGFDTSELVNRPNRGPDAIQLYDRGELTGEALRREHGFSEADGLNAAERRQRELRDLLGHAGIDSVTANKLLELLGYVAQGQVDTTAPTPPPVQQVPATRTDTAPPPPPPPTAQPRAIPQRPAASIHHDDGTLLAATAVAQYAASAALEYAGKRLLASDRSYRSQYRDVPHHELHAHILVGGEDVGFLLDGAFRTFDQLPDLAPVRHVVERHVTALLLSGNHLDRGALSEQVAQSLGKLARA